MIKVLIVGCGRIVSKHISSIKKLKKKFKIIGIVDIDKKKLLYYTQKLKVPGYLDIDKALNNLKPDLVSILTPSGLHYEHAIRVIKNNINTIIEKPMCLNLAHANEIKKLSKKNKTKVYVVMQNKFNIPIKKLLKDINLKEFGKIFHASVVVKWKRDQKYYNLDKWRGTWKFDGGVICNQSSHHLDLLRTIMGEPVSLFAKGFKHLNDIETEDTALVIFKFNDNKSAIMEATTAMRPYDQEGSLSIMGTRGSAKIGGFALNEINYYHTKSKKKIVLEKYKTNPKNVYGYGHLEFYKHVYKSIKNNTNSNFDAQNSFKTVKLINAIYKSIEEKKEIFLNKNIVSMKLGVYKK